MKYGLSLVLVLLSVLFAAERFAYWMTGIDAYPTFLIGCDSGIDLAVYSRLDNEIPISHPRESVKRAGELRTFITTIANRCERWSYLNWIGHFENRAKDFIKIDESVEKGNKAATTLTPLP